MKFRFEVESNAGVPHRLASAEIVFEDLGVVITGLAVWARKDRKPGLSVTFPAQRTGEGTEVRYFDYIRSLDEKGEGVKRLKQTIVDAFQREHPQLAGRRRSAQVAAAPAEDYGY
jgi:hypothetical protein